MKQPLRYKTKNSYPPKVVLWKNYLIVMACSFVGGGISVVAYKFFSAAQKNHIPVVGGYGLPVRTYVAPQEEKNLQKIYDLDQEEAPIVEKILPYSDVPETSHVQSTSEKDLKSSSHNLTPGVPKDDGSPETPAPSAKESMTQTPKLTTPSMSKEDLPKSVNKNVDSGLGKNSSSGTPLPYKKAEPRHESGQHLQIGAVFSDLNRAKEFVVRLKAKAEGYNFKIQSRTVKGKTVYRIVTHNPLLPEEIKKLLQLVPSLKSSSP